MKIQLSLRAENLENVAEAPRSASDPFAVLTYGDDKVIGGQTEVVRNSLCPDWTKVFFLEYESGSPLEMIIDIFHKGDAEDQNKRMGQANFVLDREINNSESWYHTETLQTGGSLVLHVAKSCRGDTAGSCEFRLRGMALLSDRRSLNGATRPSPFFEIARKEESSVSNQEWWTVVHRSEYVRSNSNPYWDPVNLDLELLCSCDVSWPLQVTILDKKDDGSHSILGSFNTTAKDLVAHRCLRGNGDRSSAFKLTLGRKRMGLITVVEAQLVTSKTES